MEYINGLTSIIMPSCHVLSKANKACYRKSIQQNYEKVEFLIFASGMGKLEYNYLINFLEKNNIYKHKIKSLYSKSKVGIGIARRSLLRLSKGEYLIFFDSDDKPQKNIIRKKVSISKQKKSNIIFSNANIHSNFLPKNKFIKRDYYSYLNKLSQILTKEIFEGFNPFPNSGTLIRKIKIFETLLENYPSCRHEDFIFYKRLMLINKEFTITNQYLISYNISLTSTGNKFKSRIWHFSCLVKELKRSKIKAFLHTVIGTIIQSLIRLSFLISNTKTSKKLKVKQIFIS